MAFDKTPNTQGNANGVPSPQQNASVPMPQQDGQPTQTNQPAQPAQQGNAQPVQPMNTQSQGQAVNAQPYATTLQGQAPTGALTNNGMPVNPNAPVMPNQQQSKHRKPLTAQQKHYAIIGAIVLGVVIVLGIIYAALNSTVFSPNHVATDYISSIAEGDFDKASTYLKTDLSSNESVLLKNKAAKKDSLIKDPHVANIRVSDDGTRDIDLTYTVSGHNVHDEITVAPSGSKLLLFKNWKVTSIQYIYLGVPKSVESLKVNDITVSDKNSVKDDKESALMPGERLMSLPAFPGMYDVKADESGYLVSKDQKVTAKSVDNYGHTADATEIKLKPTEKLKNEINAQMKASVDKCASSTELNPKGCFIGFGIDEPDYKNIKWSVNKYPAIDNIDKAFDEYDNSFSADVTGEMKMEYDDDFGDGDVFHNSTTPEEYVHGTYKIVNGKVQLKYDDLN